MRRSILFLSGLFFLSFFSRAQDTIMKTNGNLIAAKILEVGTNAISYKKFGYLDGPLFVVNKTEISFIKYFDGQKEEFSKDIVTAAAAQKPIMDTTQIKKNEYQKSDVTNSSGMNKIEELNGRYTVNGQKASRKDVNKLLEKSKNPAITVPLKAAKTTKTFQKIVKITSIPTTIGGSTALLWTGIDMYNDIRRGRDNTSTYVSTFTSFLTTVTFPVTGKILKNKSDKMYGKLIDLYNITN